MDRNVDGDGKSPNQRLPVTVYPHFYVTIVRGNWNNGNGNLSER